MRLPLILLLALGACHQAQSAEGGGDEAFAIPLPLREPTIMEGGTAEARGLGIIDGDTFELSGEIVRISNIDAPEMPPRSRCWAEARLAREATRELQRIREETLTPGGYRLAANGKDQYGRTLGQVSYDGGKTDVGELMIERGFAVPWTGRRWDWCGPVTNDPNGARVVRAGPSVAATLLDEPG